MELHVIFVLALLIWLVGNSSAMSREQLKKSGKLMKKSCMPKNQVTEEMVGSIEQGTFIEDRNVMCYIACMYQMVGAIKKGKIDHDAFMKQVDVMFPPELKAPTKQTIDQCEEVPKKYNDLCESAYWTAKCLYEADPDIFFFP